MDTPYRHWQRVLLRNHHCKMDRAKLKRLEISRSPQIIVKGQYGGQGGAGEEERTPKTTPHLFLLNSVHLTNQPQVCDSYNWKKNKKGVLLRNLTRQAIWNTATFLLHMVCVWTSQDLFHSFLIHFQEGSSINDICIFPMYKEIYQE